MRRILVRVLAFVALLGLALAAQAQTIGWPEATEALAQEKSKAQSCVDLLKSVADKKTLLEARAVYLDAKATSDGVIAGLSIVLVERGEPADLPKLQDSLEKSGAGLQKACDAAAKAARDSKGHKGAIDKIITDSIGPVIDALKSAVGAIWDHWVETKKIEREMILGQLNAAKWPDF